MGFAVEILVARKSVESAAAHLNEIGTWIEGKEGNAAILLLSLLPRLL